MVNNMKGKLDALFSEIKNGNNLGEKITLVGATKTKDVETINLAVSYGLEVVAENRVQEFIAKRDFISEKARQHFIGRLQTNKVKYLVGKVELIQSVDSLKLAEIINKTAEKLGVIQDVLLEVNVGEEESKGGFSVEELISIAKQMLTLPYINVKGIMAMLPKSDDEVFLSSLCVKARNLFERLKDVCKNAEYLSMGMSNDYKIAIKNGSNMIRLGKTIFGERGENINGIF